MKKSSRTRLTNKGKYFRRRKKKTSNRKSNRKVSYRKQTLTRYSRKRYRPSIDRYHIRYMHGGFGFDDAEKAAIQTAKARLTTSSAKGMENVKTFTNEKIGAVKSFFGNLKNALKKTNKPDKTDQTSTISVQSAVPTFAPPPPPPLPSMPVSFTNSSSAFTEAKLKTKLPIVPPTVPTPISVISLLTPSTPRISTIAKIQPTNKSYAQIAKSAPKHVTKSITNISTPKYGKNYVSPYKKK